MTKQDKKNLQAENPGYELILEEIIRIQHEELNKRYQLKNLQRTHNLPESIMTSLNQDKLNKVISLFKLYFYPADIRRHERDEAFSSLIQLLHEPRKLINLFPSMPRIILKHGLRFPKALAMGLEAVKTFHLSLDFEKKIIANILNNSSEPWNFHKKKSHISNEIFQEAVRKINYEESVHFFKLGYKIFSTVKKPEIIKVTLDILKDIEYAMKKIHLDYKQHLKAIEYGKNVLYESIVSFEGMSHEEIDSITETVKVSEKKYLESIYAS